MSENKENVPKIRFPGFTDAWKWHHLRDVSERVRGNDGRMDLPTLTISAGSGWLDQRERFSGNIAGNEQKNYTLLKKGQLSYNHGNSKLAKYGAVFELRTYEEALVPRVYHSFETNDLAVPDFIEYMFATKKPNRELGKLISSGARMDGLLNINYDDFMGIKIMLPSVEEQKKISELLRTFDHLITLHQRMLNNVRNLKAGLLQKMFPKDGEDFPEVRFPGFTDAWKQRKVGELTNVASAARVHKEEWAKSGVPFFRSSDVVSAYKGIENEKAFISYELYEKLSKVSGKLEKDDILITGGGSIGIPYTVPNNEPMYSKDADLIWIKSSEKFNSQYLYTYFTSPKFRRYVSSVSHVGTIAHYTIEQVKETPIYLPSIGEQNKIALYFTHLDNLINLHERKLKHLQEQKKALLQQMFV